MMSDRIADDRRHHFFKATRVPDKPNRIDKPGTLIKRLLPLSLVGKSVGDESINQNLGYSRRGRKLVALVYIRQRHHDNDENESVCSSEDDSASSILYYILLIMDYMLPTCHGIFDSWHYYYFIILQTILPVRVSSQTAPQDSYFVEFDNQRQLQ
eukprot:scaffold17482_cov52-Attheya_sp.AAC.3